MKQGIHPDYGPVVFRDSATGDLMLTRSTLAGRVDPARTVDLDGTAYPVIDVDVTVHSHPFWTGRGRVVDSEGRVERFERRFGARSASEGVARR